jgi:hypothetical protein
MQDSDSDDWDALEGLANKKQKSLSSSPGSNDGIPLVGESAAFAPHIGDECDKSALHRSLHAIDTMLLRWGTAHFRAASEALEAALVSASCLIIDATCP